MISINEWEIIVFNRHASVPLSCSPSEPELAGVRSEQGRNSSAQPSSSCCIAIAMVEALYNPRFQGFVTEDIETISGYCGNNANDSATKSYITRCGTRIPTAESTVEHFDSRTSANDSELISTEPFRNIVDLELIEALEKLYQMKQTPSVRAAELCLRAEIASRGNGS
jgi:hypothetical protein